MATVKELMYSMDGEPSAWWWTGSVYLGDGTVWHAMGHTAHTEALAACDAKLRELGWVLG